jgi:hypothetical protein
VTLLEPPADGGAIIVVAAVRATGDPLDHDLVGCVDEHGRVQLAVGEPQDLVEGVGLGERTREPVEKETPGHLDALLDHGDHEVVRHQSAGRHVFRGLPAQLGVARAVFAQESPVAMRACQRH